MGQYQAVYEPHMTFYLENLLNIRWSCLEGVLHMFMQMFRLCFECVLNTISEYVLNISEDALNMLSISSEHFADMCVTCSEYVPKTSWP